MRALCAREAGAASLLSDRRRRVPGQRYLERPSLAEALENRSLVKHRPIVEEAGGWPRLQRLLGRLAAMAAAGTGIAAVATVVGAARQPHVAAAIIGARHARHLSSTLTAASMKLDDDDVRALDVAAAEGPAGARDVYALGVDGWWTTRRCHEARTEFQWLSWWRVGRSFSYCLRRGLKIAADVKHCPAAG